MGRGRKPTPTRLKVINGNPGKRALNKNEPKPPPSEYDAPPGLSKEAKKIWERDAPQLIRLGVLTQVDRPMFGAYCEKYAQYYRYQKKASNSPDLIKTPSGYVQQNPYISMANRCFEQLCKIATEFGITPSSRSRVSTSPGTGDPGNRWGNFSNAG